MKQQALVIDYKYCTGCHVCEIACRNEHGMSLDEWGIQVEEQGPVQMNGKWNWYYVPVPSDACDLCEDRVAEGKKPACVHHCNGQCMEVVPVAELSARVAELGDHVACFIM